MEKRLDICACSQLPKVSNRKNPYEDRISCLPDEILYFIQSLLDYKKVAQMSILSRRWLNLWIHTPVLHFGAPILLDLHLRAPVAPDGRNQKLECDKFVSTISLEYDDDDERECYPLSHWIREERNQKQECDKSVFWMTCHAPDGRNQKRECDKIVNWMSRVLRKGQKSNEISASYTLYKCYKKKDIDDWWEDALAREFQSLELIFSSNDCLDSSYVFPDRFLSFCNDCLFWTLCSEAFDSHFLESCGLKFLKSLSLKGILITHKSIDFFLLNCPFLERLEVVASPVLVFFQIKKAHSLALKYLKLMDCDNLGIIDISYCNIVSLKLTAPVWLMLKHLPRLIELNIEETPCECRRDSLCHPELKTLTLSPDKPKDLAGHFKLTSQLTKLERLVINVDASGDKSLQGLISLINACPHLQEFVLMLNWINPLRSGNMLTEKAEKCCLKHLKVVEFLGYYGRSSDVQLIVHLMENADNLEKVIIDPWNPEHNERCYEEEEEARNLALQQLKEYVPPCVQLIIR